MTTDDSEWVFVYPATKVFVPGTLATICRSADQHRLDALKGVPTRYITRVYVSSEIAFTGRLREIICYSPVNHIVLEQERVRWMLVRDKTRLLAFDLVADEKGMLDYIRFEVDSPFPELVAATARTEVGRFLDCLQRVAWSPLAISRVDVHEPNGAFLLCQAILPLTGSLNLSIGGSFGYHSAFSPYEALLREAVTTSSPHYRLLCSVKLFEGLQDLRTEMRLKLRGLGKEHLLPAPPRLSREEVLKAGFPADVARTIKSWDDFAGKLYKHRNAIAHFFFGSKKSPEGEVPYDLSDGFNADLATSAAVLALHYGRIALADLAVCYNQHIHDPAGTRMADPSNVDETAGWLFDHIGPENLHPDLLRYLEKPKEE